MLFVAAGWFVLFLMLGSVLSTLKLQSEWMHKQAAYMHARDELTIYNATKLGVPDDVIRDFARKAEEARR